MGLDNPVCFYLQGIVIIYRIIVRALKSLASSWSFSASSSASFWLFSALSQYGTFFTSWACSRTASSARIIWTEAQSPSPQSVYICPGMMISSTIMSGPELLHLRTGSQKSFTMRSSACRFLLLCNLRQYLFVLQQPKSGSIWGCTDRSESATKFIWMWKMEMEKNNGRPTRVV